MSRHAIPERQSRSHCSLSLLLAILMLAFVSMVTPVCAADESVWTLKFQDDFERAELGPDWYSGDAIIENGRLVLGRNKPATANITRTFPGDVRLEYDAEAYPGRPPCDLSANIASDLVRKMNYVYLLAFGGANNTVNWIRGGNQVPRVDDGKPIQLIEPGRVYHMAATKEGKRLTLEADGKILVESVDAEILGGTGFDHVGLVTWNGMLADNVRVYERKTPHPDTPRYIQKLEGLAINMKDGQMSAKADAPQGVKDAVDAYNRGNLKAAEGAFSALDGEYRAAGLAYVYGHLDWDEAPDDFPRVAVLFDELAKANPGDQRLADYAWAAGKFGLIRIFPKNPLACGRLFYLGEENNPFYNKAYIYRARFLRSNAQESGDRELLAKTVEMFKELLAKSPGNAVLKQLSGERIPWGEELIDKNPATPEWAATLHEMYARQLRIMEWWFQHRQMPDGQMGSGWGDDCEALRSWGPFAMISTSSKVIHSGIEKLCNGIWDNALTDGYCSDWGDVEHSAEPSADSVPTMVLLKYGDPLWFERNLISCRHIKDHYTGIDANGYVRFKSGFYGGGRVSEHVQDGGDNYYSCRPLKHFLWAGWYGDEESSRFYASWAKGWVDATMTPKYTKPAGVPPLNIWYPSGDIAVPGKEWDDPYLNIYGPIGLGNHWLHDSYLAAYSLTRDPAYLQPLHTMMRWAVSEMPAGATNADIAKDPEAWAISKAKSSPPNAPTLVFYRWLTGDASYESFAKENPAQKKKFRPESNLGRRLARMNRALSQLRYNFDISTREVLQMDRAGLEGAADSFAAYTGSVRAWGDAAVPTMAVTWEVDEPDFAAMVVQSSDTSLRVWVYNFASEPKPLGMKLWQLVPGEYSIAAGNVLGGTDMEREYKWTRRDTFTLKERAGVYRLEVPSRQEYAVDFRLVKRNERPAVLADAAICGAFLKSATDSQGRETLTAEVGNLGNAAIEGLAVAIQQIDRSAGDSAGDKWKELERKTISLLPPCKNYQIGKASVNFAGYKRSPEYRIVLDPDDTVMEICELNNMTVLAK